MMAFPPTMEELHLHLVAVAPTTAAAVASEGRAVAAYLVSEGWRIRAAVDSVGLRLPHGSAERAETLADVPAGSPFAHPSALLRLEPRSAPLQLLTKLGLVFEQRLRRDRAEVHARRSRRGARAEIAPRCTRRGTRGAAGRGSCGGGGKALGGPATC